MATMIIKGRAEVPKKVNELEIGDKSLEDRGGVASKHKMQQIYGITSPWKERVSEMGRDEMDDRRGPRGE